LFVECCASLFVNCMPSFIMGFVKQTRNWPAPGSADTELGVLMEPEVSHGKAEVYTRVQA